MKHRWTRENPAPEVVAYLWVWKLVRDGVNVSIRDVATYAGWTRWQARKLRERVSEEMMEWEETTQGKKTPHDSGHRPDNRRTITRVFFFKNKRNNYNYKRTRREKFACFTLGRNQRHSRKEPRSKAFALNSKKANLEGSTERTFTRRRVESDRLVDDFKA